MFHADVSLLDVPLMGGGGGNPSLDTFRVQLTFTGLSGITAVFIESDSVDV